MIKSSTPLGYVQQSVTTAANLSTVPAGATYAIITPETNAIRYRDDGTDPTASVGTPVSAGSSMTYDGDLAKIKLIAQSGTSSVSIAYYAARHP